MPKSWFMMQIAMIAVVVTSYPVSWSFIDAGLKERMSEKRKGLQMFSRDASRLCSVGRDKSTRGIDQRAR